MPTCHSSFSKRGTLLLRAFLLLFAVNIRTGFGFYCVSSGEWIPIDWVCDAQSDCSDSSDESYDLNCVYQKIFLKKGRESAALHNPWRGIHRRSDTDMMGTGYLASVSGSAPASFDNFLGGDSAKGGPVNEANSNSGALYDLLKQPEKFSTVTAPLYSKYLPSHPGEYHVDPAPRRASQNGFHGNGGHWAFNKSPNEGFLNGNFMSEHQ